MTYSHMYKGSSYFISRIGYTPPYISVLYSFALTLRHPDFSLTINLICLYEHLLNITLTSLCDSLDMFNIVTLY